MTMTKQDLKIVFMGTPDFAVASLRALVEGGFNVVGVITAPDKPAGRGRKLQESAVKQYAVAQSLRVLQPEKLKATDFIETLQSLNADLQIVVAFRMLPEAVWNMPKKGTFNLHGSLLPHYRGAAPINWAIMNGEKETGVTTFFIEHKIDTGNVLLQRRIPIGPNDNVEKIHDALMNLGADLVVETVEGILNNSIEARPQSSILPKEALKEAPKIFKEDCRINWSRKGADLHNFIRGLSPYPTAWCVLNKDSKAIQAKIYNASFKHGIINAVGEVHTDNKHNLSIACQDGWLSIHELQIAGKKRMNTEDFLRGFDATGLSVEL